MTFQALFRDLIEYIESIDPGEDQRTESDRFTYFEKAIEVDDALPDRAFALRPTQGPTHVAIGGCRDLVEMELLVRYAWAGESTAVRTATDAVLLQDRLHGAAGDDVKRILIESPPFYGYDSYEGVVEISLRFSVEYDPT